MVAGCCCQVKLYESRRPLKLENENLKSRCKQLSDELGRHKQLLANTQDVSGFGVMSVCVFVCVCLCVCMSCCLSVCCSLHVCLCLICFEMLS